MPDHDAIRPDHPSGVPSTASDETPQAPDAPIAGFETANDPTGGTTWIRRRFRLPPGDGADEALDAVLQVPGVARASLTDAGRELVADIEPGVVSDDELTAAIGRGGLEPQGWEDEPIPASEHAPSRRDVLINDEPLPSSRQGRSDLVDEESEDSFPASDAPSSWARPADDHGGSGAP
jgi:hypothetical protein